MDLGTLLAQLRKQKGQTQKEFANSLGVSNGAVAMWETNKRQPDLEMIKKISVFYHVSIDFLLDNKPSDMTKDSLSSSSNNSWSDMTENSSNTVRISSEEKELLEYYNELSVKNKRWIMGQIIDLIKKEEENLLNTDNHPKVAQ